MAQVARQTSKKAKQTNQSFRRETDTIVLDYLVWDTTRSLIRYAQISDDSDDSETKKRRAESLREIAQLPAELLNMLKMVDAFRTIFTAAHGPINLHSIPTDLESEWRILHFRLVVLRFTTLLLAKRRAVSEATPAPAALADLRYRNRIRTLNWVANLDNTTTVFSKDLLEWYNGFTKTRTSAGVASDMPIHSNIRMDGAEDIDPTTADRGAQAEYSRSIYNMTAEETSPETIELIDLIPMFIEMTAEYGARDNAWHTTTNWLDLAADVMLQSSIEKLLKEPWTSRIVEAFAWGTEGMPKEREEGVNDVQNVFCMPGEDATAENAIVSSFAWTILRNQCLDLLVPEGTEHSGTGPISEVDRARATTGHLQQLARQYPVTEFEERLLAFLESLCEGYGRPIFAQLENEADCGIELHGERLEDLEEERLRQVMRGRPK